MVRVFTLTRDVTPEECDWLSRTYRKGEEVYPYRHCTYGCISYAGRAVTEDRDGGMFFELPLNALREGGA